jgi:hypothetical protein
MSLHLIPTTHLGGKNYLVDLVLVTFLDCYCSINHILDNFRRYDILDIEDQVSGSYFIFFNYF